MERRIYSYYICKQVNDLQSLGPCRSLWNERYIVTVPVNDLQSAGSFLSLWNEIHIVTIPVNDMQSTETLSVPEHNSSQDLNVNPGNNCPCSPIQPHTCNSQCGANQTKAVAFAPPMTF